MPTKYSQHSRRKDTLKRRKFEGDSLHVINVVSVAARNTTGSTTRIINAMTNTISPLLRGTCINPCVGQPVSYLTSLATET